MTSLSSASSFRLTVAGSRPCAVPRMETKVAWKQTANTSWSSATFASACLPWLSVAGTTRSSTVYQPRMVGA